MEEVVILSAVRTPIGEFQGSLSSLQAQDLGSIVIKQVLKRASVSPDDISEVIMGEVLTSGHGQNVARQAAMNADVPYTVPAFTVNKLCGSGLKSVILGYQAIRCGDANIVVCGGMESMTNAQHSTFLRPGSKLGDLKLVDTLLNDGLTDAFHNVHMGETAENMAEKFDIVREEQDVFSAESQSKAEKAIKAGIFKAEIAPVPVRKRGQEILVDTDEYPKFGSSFAALRKLKPFFRENGTVTAGNASGINDGAAAVLLCGKNEAEKRGLKPMARIIAHTSCGVHPLIMGSGPLTAITNLLKSTGWERDEVDLYEINEAFAAQALVIIKQLNLDPSKVNISGGAIALGHPIGSSGARVLVTLLHALERTGGIRGVASLCIGGGMGIAMAVERIP